MAVINGLPLGTQGKSSMKYVNQFFANSTGATSDILDSFNEDTGLNETVQINASVASWVYSPAPTYSITIQASNDRQSWTNYWSGSGTYPVSVNYAGEATGYRYYRVVFSGQMRASSVLMACAGEVE